METLSGNELKRVLDKHIGDIGLPNGIVIVLRRESTVRYVGELVCKSLYDLRDIPKLGISYSNHIQGYLWEIGLSLGMEVGSWQVPALSEKILDNIAKVRGSKTLFTVRDIVESHATDDAIVLIDNLDELTAALVLSYFRMRAEIDDKYAKDLIRRADELHIRGSFGLIYARDKVYRETGYFAGM